MLSGEVSYLIELCGNLPATPFDEDECFYGVGLVMNDIHEEILDFARAVERWEIYRAQRRAEKRGSVNQDDKTVKDG